MNTTKRLKIALIERGLVQQKLANMAGMSRTTLNGIINGRLNPTEQEKRAIASVLQKKVEDIFGTE
jgi:DNA-binding XRE family transcriptional regulator